MKFRLTLTVALAAAAALSACASSGEAAARRSGAGDPDLDPPSHASSTSNASSTSHAKATATRSSAESLAGERAGAPQLPVAPPARELSPRAQRLFDEAVAAAEEQKRLKVPTDWETLERRWRAVLDAEQVPEAWFNLGVALEKQRRTDEARVAYQRALQLEPRLSPAAANLLLLDEPKEPAAAAQRWVELVRRFPEDAVARARLAGLYEAAGQHDEAWKLAREALLRDPRSVSAYKVMMRVALARGNLDLSNLLAVKARKLDERDPEIVAFEGDVLLRQKDEPGAVAQWKKAIVLKDDFLPARYALLASAFSKRHWEGVAEQARAILRADPDARVQLALGVALRYLGKPDQALAAYDQAEKLGGGKLPEVHLARGIALMKSKEQCEPALVELRRYVAAAGPAVASEGPAMRLQRECEKIIIASKEAEEAAREMKAEAEREAARKAAAASSKEAKPAGASGSQPQPAPQPTSPGAPPPAVRQSPTSTADRRDPPIK